MVAEPAADVLVPPRPLRVHDRAAEILGEALLRELAVVPFELSDDTILLATASADLDAVAVRIQRASGYEARAVWETPDLIERSLTAHFAPATLAALIDAQSDAWRSALGDAAADSPLDSAADAELEALALSSDLPYVRLNQLTAEPALARVLPADFARQALLLPFLVAGGVLFIAAAAPPDADTDAALEALIGPAYQLALADPDALAFALDAALTPSDRQTETVESGDGAIERLLAWRPFDAAANEEASADGRPRELRSRARALGIALADLSAERPQAACAALLPRQIGERLGALVLSLAGEQARVALSGDDPLADAATVAALIGKSVQPLLATRGAVLEALAGIAAVHPLAPLPPTLEKLLCSMHGIRGAALADAEMRAARASEPLIEVLLARGWATVSDLAEAKGLRAGLPWLRLDHVLPRRDAIEALPAEAARALHALPLRLQGDVLHVAVATLDSLPAIERAAGRAARPVLAERVDLDRAIERFCSGDHRAAPEMEALLDQLLGQGRIDRGQRARALTANAIGGAPADIALVHAGAGSQVEVADLLAAHLALPTIDVRLRERHDRVIGPLGGFGSRRQTIDPVNRDIATLLPADLAERLTALPVERKGAIVLALADPFDRVAITAVESALGERVTVAVSPRGGLEAAIRRSYGRRNVGDHLVETGLVSPDELVRAIKLHERTGVRIGKALLTLGYVTQEQLTTILAEQFDLPYFDLAPEQVDPAIAKLVPEDVCRVRGVLPLAVDEQGALLAMTDPLDAAALDEARLYLQRPVQPVMVTDRQFDQVMESLYRDAYLLHSADDLLSRSPDDSAFRVLSRAQKFAFIGAGVAIVLGLIVNWVLTLETLVSIACLFYFAFSAYKLYLIYKSLSGSLEVVVTAEDLAALDDRDLPLYSVLVPMYKEGEVLPILVDALDRLDYPKTKLEVLLLLEEDDTATVEAARRMRLPEGFRVLVVPHSQPKGKPKACNYGLLHARGEFVVLFDAEDVPEPDQLKKALIAFERGGENVVTVQAKLNYFNRDQNLLTRWFTSEYAMWFDLLLPGLQNSGAPIPLGGTSNHFRADALRELGGWDPFNVTEDADLGIRLFKRGYRTCVVNSTTYEEANSDLYNWIRQRSRWIKGYMQTWLVHMRHPVRLWRDIGTYPFLSLQMIILGTFFAFLLNPIFWGLTALWFLAHWGVIQQIFPGPVFYIGTVALYFGNFAFVYINVAGALRREYHSLVKYTLLTPLYWALMSIAAWKALYQLIFRPSYWEKTDHGLYRGKVTMPKQGRAPAGRE